MAHSPVGTPQEHVRVALELLDELEGQWRVLRTGLPASQGALLAAARRRLWLAVAALDSPSGAVGPWGRRGRVAGRRAGPLIIGLAVVAWSVSALAFLIRGVWRSTRAVVRLVYKLQVLLR